MISGIMAMAISTNTNATHDAGNLRYGLYYQRGIDVTVKAVLAPKSRWRDALVFTATYSYIMTLGPNKPLISYRGRTNWVRTQVCGRTSAGNVSRQCVDGWNESTGNEARCRAVTNETKAWSNEIPGYRASGNDANALAAQIDKKMQENVIKLEGVGPPAGYAPLGINSAKVTMDNNIVYTVPGLNPSTEVWGAWCVVSARATE